MLDNESVLAIALKVVAGTSSTSEEIPRGRQMIADVRSSTKG
ncbi:MAG: hypothetical protein ACKPKO_33980 [Candidatus Fonsibacter sp.]